jgi:hypothetical protein
MGLQQSNLIKANSLKNEDAKPRAYGLTLHDCALATAAGLPDRTIDGCASSLLIGLDFFVFLSPTPLAACYGTAHEKRSVGR